MPSKPSPKPSKTESAQFTPGPWKLEYDDDDFAGTFTLCMATAIKNRGMYNANHLIDLYEGVWDDDIDFAETRANAQLISAAPELYEALKAISEDVDLALDSDSANLQRARAALARARGERG